MFELLVTNKKSNKRVMEPCLGLSVPLCNEWVSQVQALSIQQLAPVLCVHLVREADDYGMCKATFLLCFFCVCFFVRLKFWLFQVVKSDANVQVVLSHRQLSLRDQVSSTPIEYELESVVLHQGESLFKGHYVARTREEGLSRVLFFLLF